jgi:hypothetical protein
MRTTLLDAKNSRIPSAIGVCSSEQKFVDVLNEAQQRLLTKGLWFGTYGRFRICAPDGCITLPAQIATIERVAMNGMNIPVRDEWYEFLENGYGPRNSNSCNSSGGGCGSPWNSGGQESLYRGRFCTFKDIIPTGKKLNFICDLASDVGKEVLALGYDDNGNWIRTDQGGIIKDGELIAFAQSAGTNSVNNFSCVTDLQLPDNMDGQSWLYEYKVSDASKRMIGKYEYFETRPYYARYYFPTICSSSSGTCNRSSVEIIGKLEYIPAKQDTDYLIIGNIPALKEMCVAIVNAEKTPDTLEKNKIIASGYAMAISELDHELSHYLGEGRVLGINLSGSSIYSNNEIPVLI